MLCHRHLPHQLVYRGSRDRKEPEAAAGEQHHHASRLFALRANHHHQVKMVCKNAGTPRGDQRWNRWERGLEEGWKGATSLALLFRLGKNGGCKRARRGLRGLRSFSDSARTEAGRRAGRELDGNTLKGGKLYNYFFINLLTI